MKNIMPPINTPDNAFHDGNPATGEQGTIVPGLWLNNSQGAIRNIQQELISVLTEAGIEIDESQNNQLLASILKLIIDKTPDLPIASLLIQGIVKLSNATNSTSETVAATSKAVRAVDIAALKIANNLSEIKETGAAAVADALKNLTLTDMGIGLTSIPDITDFDWQNFKFTSGANYLTSYNSWLNPPEGLTFNAGTRVSITVDYIATNSTRIGLTIIPDTGAQTNFHVFKVLCVGAAGSRAFTFREEWNSAIPVPISGGGTGGKTAAEALTNLGLSDAFTASEIAATPWVNLTLSNAWTTYPDLKCAYRKVLGLVFVEVNARNGTFSDGTILATLPVGYRPAKAVIAPVLGQSLANTVPARVSVNVDGAIVLIGFSSAATAGLLFNFSLQ